MMDLMSQPVVRHSCAALASFSALTNSASSLVSCVTASHNAQGVMTNTTVTNIPVCQANLNALVMGHHRHTAYQWHRVVMATLTAQWEARMNSTAHRRLVQLISLNATTVVASLMYGLVMETMTALMDQMNHLTALTECALRIHSDAHLAAAYPWLGAVMATTTAQVEKMKALRAMKKP